MNWRWVFLMAWRDSRKNRSRLLLFISSIVFGIAALVAMKSFNENLKRDIDTQAALLIGADLDLHSTRKPDSSTLAFIDSIKKLSEQTASEERFMSMIRFPKADGSRLVQVRALTGDFPFYGNLETLPEDAYKRFGKDPEVLVEKTLMIQYNAQLHDPVQLGTTNFTISGNLITQPGQAAIRGAMAPAVFVPLKHLENSGLQQTGSRIEYHYYFKFPAQFNVDDFVEKQKERLTQLQLRSSTVSTTKENTGRSFSDMARFMELVGFVALLLGCIGVSSAVHIYIREKLVSVAILRCLGTSSRQAFFIFLVQFSGIGLIGGILGALLGTLIQYAIPIVMQDIVPVTLSNRISLNAIIEGIGLGFVISILFALLPLISVRRISPLRSLRVSDEPEQLWKDRLKWWIYLLILAFVVVFSRLQLNGWMQTLFFIMGLGLTFALLYSVARGFTYLIRRYFPKKWPYLWRQGLSNLYRPNNQTIVLLISIGLSTALIATLFFVQDMLLQRVKLASSENQANMVLFDIQPLQQDAIKNITREAGLSILEDVPIVTMQLTAINGKRANDVLSDSTSNISTRSFRGEIRATYRDSLTLSEKVVEGHWIGNVSGKEVGQVSLEKSYANRIGVEIGDSLLFNVQGVEVPAVASSFREVDWNRFQSNFRVVFAKGTIDNAPKFYLMMTHVDDENQSAIFQQTVVNRFPNVSVIDINTALDILDSLLQRIAFVIQFIGAFSILTGVVVLIASVRISKYQRLRENVLLRTLGASRRQVFTITATEYLLLGVLASFTGIVIALIASNLLGIFVFEIVFVPSIGFILVLTVLVSLLTVGIGVINSLSVMNRSPLEALRKE
ncbi:FtsX-like permease family protein [Sphingobacterium phlebotomi]|uniref:FtsX-like permease family protein n=1 Tax=Sphingobacterium phlebotomi TaxID=2605433 RepID=A0A5D4H115_9SPHI|nr:FtsX-like permease family protein [Sphingobacterium phlebotomi]TYR34174.1 FtsX-like permease family protein [Sphingobacterium phlebotomi]